MFINLTRGLSRAPETRARTRESTYPNDNSHVATPDPFSFKSLPFVDPKVRVTGFSKPMGHMSRHPHPHFKASTFQPLAQPWHYENLTNGSSSNNNNNNNNCHSERQRMGYYNEGTGWAGTSQAPDKLNFPYVIFFTILKFFHSVSTTSYLLRQRNSWN